MKQVIRLPFGNEAMRWIKRAVVIQAAFVTDELFGEPPLRIHPVALYGKYLSFCEEIFWTDTVSGGFRYLGASVFPIAVLTRVLRKSSVVDFAAIEISIAKRSLVLHATEVLIELNSNNVEGARSKVSLLVGRDCSTLGVSEICAATIESIAENFNDAVVATIFWGNWMGSFGSFFHRVANTCDALVGKKNSTYRYFGMLSARLDDVLGFMPARLGAGLVAVLSKAPKTNYLKAHRDSKAHPSPNAGLMEAIFAWSLGVQLGGQLQYHGQVSYRPLLGPDVAPMPGDIERALALLDIASTVFVLLVSIVDLLVGLSLVIAPKVKNLRKPAP